MISPRRRIHTWVGGLAEWTFGNTAFLSVAFTWRLNEARDRARFYKQLGYHVRAGGPATFVRKNYLADVAELGGELPDAVYHHSPLATFASRGCPVGCWFCIVPKMEGRQFTLYPDFPVRPVLCDNNLSALPPKYQEHIIERYRAEDVPLLDANSGFEPRTFDASVFERWRRINRGPWRFAYDELAERDQVRAVMHMLRDLPPKKKRVYVLIGNEPIECCLGRLREVIEWGGEPHAQPFIKLNALERTPRIRFDWTAQSLADMARWANRRIWRYASFSDYDRSKRSTRSLVSDRQWPLFLPESTDHGRDATPDAAPRQVGGAL
jgi:hypothetical protein